ncbi:MAG: hypothetical protein P4L50_00695, partial [Anaerolineaceae bacterium]|nr:hypothetical protein [Anaerolineaceae bacterium]
LCSVARPATCAAVIAGQECAELSSMVPASEPQIAHMPRAGCWRGFEVAALSCLSPAGALSPSTVTDYPQEYAQHKGGCSGHWTDDPKLQPGSLAVPEWLRSGDGCWIAHNDLGALTCFKPS